MCLGIPMRVLSIEGFSATCAAADGRTGTVDLSLVGPQEPGTWVLDFLGAAREVLDPENAAQISRALEGLQSLLNGGGLGDAFADLEAREPSLPPHLEAARRAGAKTA
ncbi:MAG: HypC/HybG/HupF family hydrogenase formation chaperone [Rhodospirillum sp.]|nr:HypC/HybG/HupF family hydrogenase formation chaperone [Rhodospirillum sp.]MCF8490993.1 HypC/HybG/HupF family hydrogenase formation chaperone [Rhodospirillum sp.]MCF8499488.1 HypC/HybG/HupF family hydrogenase formation chaperone [Rhodospirillum sp.]